MARNPWVCGPGYGQRNTPVGDPESRSVVVPAQGSDGHQHALLLDMVGNVEPGEGIREGDTS